MTNTFIRDLGILNLIVRHLLCNQLLLVSIRYLLVAMWVSSYFNSNFLIFLAPAGGSNTARCSLMALSDVNKFHSLQEIQPT